MAPKTWAKPDQFKYLNAKLEVYLRHQAEKKGTRSDGRLTRFFDELFGEWFLNWPEIEACVEEGTLPAEASRKNTLPFEPTMNQDNVLKEAIEMRRRV